MPIQKGQSHHFLAQQWASLMKLEIISITVLSRLKLTGAWWKKDIADDMLSLRALRANNRWEEYWTGSFINKVA